MNWDEVLDKELFLLVEILICDLVIVEVCEIIGSRFWLIVVVFIKLFRIIGMFFEGVFIVL